MSFKKEQKEETNRDSGISFDEALKLSRHRQFLNKINIYTQLNMPFRVVEDKEGFIIEFIEGEVDAEKDNEIENEVWFGVEISEKIKLPMPTHCLKDKKYCAKEFGALMVLSNKSIGEGHRYLYKNKFNTKELAKDLNIGRSTLDTNIKKLEKLDCNVLDIVSTQQGVVYKLYYGVMIEENKISKFTTINHRLLKSLVCSFSSGVVKLYCIISCMSNEIDFIPLENKWLAEQIGLSPKSKNNLDSITDMVANLELCGFIETKKTNIFKWDKERNKKVPHISKQYRLRTIDEWKKIQSKVR